MEEGAGVIFLIIIGLILYFAWEVVAILLLLGLVFCIAKKIYKMKWSHSVLLMYMWIVYSCALVVLISIPITHGRWFEYQKSWFDDIYQLALYSTTVDNDRDNYIEFILDNNFYTTDSSTSSEKYELYNRLTSQDSEHLYLDFSVGMPAYKFFFMNQNDQLEEESLYYGYNSDSSYKKYELIDGLNFVCNGIFVNKKLEGVVLQVPHDYYYNNTIPGLGKLGDRFAQKFGIPHEFKSDSLHYVSKWIFDDKHIIVASIEKGANTESYSSYDSRFNGVIIYNPYAILPLIEKLKSNRIQADNERKQEEIREREERRQSLIKQQREREAARQREIDDSISALKKKNEVQNGF